MTADLNQQLLDAITNEDSALVQACLRAGADVNHLSAAGISPLLVAVDTMNVGLVETLLQHGANPNPDPQQVYALPLNVAVDVAIQAVLNGHMALISNETVALLVQHGADYTVKDRSGKSAVETAVNYNSAAENFFMRLTGS